MKNIAKNTYFIKGGTNTGVYTYGNNAVIIDPGLAGARPVSYTHLTLPTILRV